jgi:hypothetical protein
VKERLEKARRRALLADSFDEMEEIMGGVGQEFQQALLRAVAEQRELARQHCPVCGEVMQRERKVTRRMKTSQGDVRFERERWVYPGCEASLFPLDERLKLEPYRDRPD